MTRATFSRSDQTNNRDQTNNTENTEKQMDNTTAMTHDDWLGTDVYDPAGSKIGEIDDIYFDNATGQPEWLVVSTGWFGTKKQFVPIVGSRPTDGGLQVDATEDHIKEAPSIDTDEDHLDAAEERRLYGHYGLDYEATDHEAAYGGRERADEGFDYSDTRAGHAEADASVTLSEEQLNVGTVERQAGSVRLHKYVVTEDVSVTVPVRKQIARIVRTDRTGEAGSIGDESVEEVVLTEEEVVVDKQVVAKEKVSVETDMVIEEEVVEGTVRKERVEIDGDV